MERVHASLLFFLTLLIASFTLTTSSNNPQTPNFKNQNAKSVKKGNVHASADGFQDMEASKDDEMMVDGLNEALFFGGPAQGYFGFPWPGGFFGFPRGGFRFPRGGFRFPRGPFGFPVGFRGGFPGGYPGGYGGYPGGDGGGYGGGGLGNTPVGGTGTGGGGGGYSGYGGKAEVKGKEVNPQD